MEEDTAPAGEAQALAVEAVALPHEEEPISKAWNQAWISAMARWISAVRATELAPNWRSVYVILQIWLLIHAGSTVVSSDLSTAQIKGRE